MRSQSVRTVSCFVNRDLGEQGAERDPPKLQGGCALAKNPMRPRVRIDWPECLMRSFKRSCHDRQLVCRKTVELPPDHRPRCVRAAAASPDPIGKSNVSGTCVGGDQCRDIIRVEGTMNSRLRKSTKRLNDTFIQPESIDARRGSGDVAHTHASKHG